tara:strand:+ start:8975 stop:9205 length:231 start_codon:yes stop_codon:yes gene_type:complete
MDWKGSNPKSLDSANLIKRRLEKMSDEQISRLENACCEILNFINYDTVSVHPQKFEPVDYILYLIHEKLGFNGDDY